MRLFIENQTLLYINLLSLFFLTSLIYIFKFNTKVYFSLFSLVSCEHENSLGTKISLEEANQLISNYTLSEVTSFKVSSFMHTKNCGHDWHLTPDLALRYNGYNLS